MVTLEQLRSLVDCHGLIHRSEVIAAGYTDRDLAGAVRRREIARVFRGVFVPEDNRTRAESHRLAATALVVSADTRLPLSHQFAAVVHGLEMLKPHLDCVHTTLGSGGSGKKTRYRHHHVSRLVDGDVVEVRGIAVTSLERTAVDVARTSPMGFAGALTVFDSAVRRGADRESMATMLSGQLPGVGPARRALAFASPLSENPGESWGRAQIIEAGLPVPRLQHEFFDARGALVGRTDYDWDERLIGEFDGRVKYTRGLGRGETIDEVVWREKKREDALRRLGAHVVRWIWTDLEARAVPTLVRHALIDAGCLAA